MVDVDEERLKVFARGARCVSLSSATVSDTTKAMYRGYRLLVSFQLIVEAVSGKELCVYVLGRGQEGGFMEGKGEE